MRALRRSPQKNGRPRGISRTNNHKTKEQNLHSIIQLDGIDVTKCVVGTKYRHLFIARYRRHHLPVKHLESECRTNPHLVEVYPIVPIATSWIWRIWGDDNKLAGSANVDRCYRYRPAPVSRVVSNSLTRKGTQQQTQEKHSRSHHSLLHTLSKDSEKRNYPCIIPYI